MHRLSHHMKYKFDIKNQKFSVKAKYGRNKVGYWHRKLLVVGDSWELLSFRVFPDINNASNTAGNTTNNATSNITINPSIVTMTMIIPAFELRIKFDIINLHV